MTGRTFIIVGGGQCAASAAATLRSAGFDGRLVIVAEEPVLPYERPPLSKDYLTGRLAAEELPVRSADWYADNDVELLLDEKADKLDVDKRTVGLSGGETLRYDALLLATGGRPRPFRGAPAEFDGARVVYLRTVADSDRLGKALGQREPLVVLGGGFIGCEVAASARKLGAPVTVLEMAGTPLEHALGPELGTIVAEIHRDNGVEVRTSERVESVADSGNGLVITTDRGRLECGLLLAAVGMVPNTELVEGTAVECANGILVDEYGRTSVPGIYAAGDVAAHRHPNYGRHVRVEHHDNARKHGAAVGRNMLGELAPYAEPHWFWSDQYDHELQSVGIADGSERHVLRGSLDDRSFIRFGIADGRLRNAVALNRARELLVATKLIGLGATVDADRLGDESVDLKGVLREARRSRGHDS
jgi:3-phenylpropionate/trans-cinnamate dioxygenase ferredoxin reductase subunit